MLNEVAYTLDYLDDEGLWKRLVCIDGDKKQF